MAGAQEKSTDTNATVPFSNVENKPVFPGCENAKDQEACFIQKINEHIIKDIQYPLSAQKSGASGRVYVKLTINKNGSFTNVIARGVDKDLDAEALRVMNKLPEIKPATHNGETVAVSFTQPVNFSTKKI